MGVPGYTQGVPRYLFNYCLKGRFAPRVPRSIFPTKHTLECVIRPRQPPPPPFCLYSHPPLVQMCFPTGPCLYLFSTTVAHPCTQSITFSLHTGSFLYSPINSTFCLFSISPFLRFFFCVVVLFSGRTGRARPIPADAVPLGVPAHRERTI